MTYLINGIPVIENNANAKFNSLQVSGGSIFLPDSNPTRNTVGFRISSLTNIDTAGRGVHANVIIDGGTQSNFAAVGTTKSYGFAAGGMNNMSGAYANPIIMLDATANPSFGVPFAPIDHSSSRLITRFPFSNENNTIVFNSFTGSRSHAAGVSSQTDGYSCGGISYGGRLAHQIPSFPTPGNSFSGYGRWRFPWGFPGISNNGIPYVGNMQKFKFANQTTTQTISNPILSKAGSSGFQDQTKGFVFGGQTPGFTASSDMTVFPFATDATSLSGVGSPSTSIYSSNVNGQTHGYIVGGFQNIIATPSYQDFLLSGTYLKSAIKFSYSNYAYTVVMPNTYPNNSTMYAYMPAHASSTSGYVIGGYGRVNEGVPLDVSQEMRKFNFASDTSSIIYGVISANESFVDDKVAYYSSDSAGYIDRRMKAPTYSPTYINGNQPYSPPNILNYWTSKQRTRFPFSTDSSATDDGGFLELSLNGATGHEGG